MSKRILSMTACLGMLALAVPAVADEQATLTLRSGERVSGMLVDMNASGFAIRVNNDTRTIAANDVAVIEFTTAARSNDTQSRINNGQQSVVLRSGQTIDGRLTDIGGTSPLRLTIETANGSRDVTSNDVAHVILAAPSSQTSQAVATSGQNGTGIRVAANQDWTATGVNVRDGETLFIRSSGEIRLNDNDRTTAGGIGGARRGAGFPLPSAPAGALIGRIDNGQPFMIGNQTSVRMPDAGQLFLGINDDVVSDNNGEFQVSISNVRRR